MKIRFLIALVASAGSLLAAPLNPDNILVAIGMVAAGDVIAPERNLVYEYTPSGQLVQIIPFNYHDQPYPSQGIEYLRQIVVDPYGFIDSFNGTFTPFLTRYDPSSGSFSHTPFPQWGTANNLNYGGVAAFQNFVYATDMGGHGIVRFDNANHTIARFGQGTDFLQLNIGLDRKLYALWERYPVAGGATDVTVFDPVTMQVLNDIAIPSDIAENENVRGVAVDQSGNLYLCGLQDGVYELNAAGVQVAKGIPGFYSMSNINIDESGRIIIGQEQGYVIMTEPTLTSFSSFLAVNDTLFAGYWAMFVSFARTVPAPVEPVPSPAPMPLPTPTPVPTHNILVSSGDFAIQLGSSTANTNTLWEFDPNGTLLQSIPFSYNNGPYPNNECLRGIAVDQYGMVDAFNGTYTPLLTRLDPAQDVLSFNETFPGFGTFPGEPWGGLAAYQNYVFLTGAAVFTGDAQRTAGLVRADLNTGDFTWLTNGANFVDVTLGLDGKIYALFTGGADATDWRQATDINVYDPVSLTLLQHVTLPADVAGNDVIRSIAVDQSGKILVCGDSGAIYRINSDGTLEASQSSGYSNLTSIAVDETGRFVTTDGEGHVITGYTSLNWSDVSFFTAFSDTDEQDWVVHAAFAPLNFPIKNPAPTPTPTPGPFTVTVSAPGGAASKFPNQSTYALDSRVAVVATPPPGYKFTGWSGIQYQLAPLNPLIVSVDSDKNFTANFAPILPTAATPSISPASGTYQKSVTVTMSDATTAAVIHYTTNGGLPTSSSPIFTPPSRTGKKKNKGTVIKLTASGSVKAIAIASGFNDSVVAEADYTVTAKGKKKH